MSQTNQIKRQLRQPKPARAQSLRLSTGSSLLNLACTGSASYGFITGHYYYLVGDSKSGKTFLSLTCLAEAARNKAFDNHRFILDEVEDGALMSIEKFFGSKVANRIEPPIDRPDLPHSVSLEEFYFNVDDAIGDKRPFIYILDSMDSLTSDSEGDKFAEQKKAFRKGREMPGSYGDGKAKLNSSGIRQLMPKLQTSNSLLIIISQTRDNVTAHGPMADKRTRSGGRSLTFYATLEIWSSCGQKITKTALGKPRTIGVNSILEVRKNRVSGRNRKVTVPILYEMGIDDIGSLVQWLIDEEYWKSTGDKFGARKVTAPDFDYEGTDIGLIKRVEKYGYEQDLIMIAQEHWSKIEEACNLGRKPRYE